MQEETNTEQSQSRTPTAPNGKEVWKRKIEDNIVGTITEADFDKAEQLKIITKRSPSETHTLMPVVSGADEGTGVTPGVPDALDYDSEDDISWKSETDEDDSFDPTIHTPSRISSSDDEDSDNEDEGTNVEGAKSDEEATYEEDQGNEAVKDTNTDP
ncbi:hypothetical protein Tco_0636763 [Tanacetum coccineum]